MSNRDYGTTIFSKIPGARLRIEPTTKRSANQKYMCGAIAVAAYFTGERKSEGGLTIMLDPSEASLAAFKIEQIYVGNAARHEINHKGNALIFGRRKTDKEEVEFGFTLKKGDRIINVAPNEEDFIHAANMLRMYAQKCNWQEAAPAEEKQAA